MATVWAIDRTDNTNNKIKPIEFARWATHNRLLRMIDIPFVATYVSENDGVRLKSSEA